MGFLNTLFRKNKPQAASQKQSFVPENELEEMLEKVVKDEKLTLEFYVCLLSSPIFVLVSEEYDGTEELPVLALDEGSIPIFSSISRIMDSEYFKENGVNYVEIKASEFLSSARDSTMQLNPFSRYTKQFTFAEITRMAKGESEVTEVNPPRGTEMLIGQPASYPDELAEALTDMFAAEPKIKKGYILLTRTGEGPGSFLIAVDYAGDLGDLQEFINKNNTPLKSVLPEGVHVDFATVAQLKKFQDIIDEVVPFYSK